MTMEEFFKNEDEIGKFLEVLMADIKPYNDRYNELLENKDDKFFEIVDYLFDKVCALNGDRLDLYDYSDPYFPKEWDIPYSELDIEVTYNMLLDMGKAQKSFHPDTFTTMFTDYIFVYKYKGRALIINTFSGQGETHYTMRVSDGKYITYTEFDLVGLRKYWEDYFERDSDNE